MARPESFNHEAVLDSVVRVFWRKGYEATSIQDLVEATGLNRSSLYNSFGSKHQLFLAAIDHYLVRVNQERLHKLNTNENARKALQAYFGDLLAFSVGEGRELGCLITNTSVEVAPHNTPIRNKLRQSLRKVEEAFFETIQRGQAQGTIRTTGDPKALARFLVGAVQGLRVLARANPDEQVLRDVIEVTLQALDPG